MGAEWIAVLALSLGEVRKQTWEDGSPRAEYEVVVTGGRERKSGPYRAWHRNGTLAVEGNYEEDRPVGRWKEYHANGALAAEGSYVRGERMAHWESFHANGKRASKGRPPRDGRYFLGSNVDLHPEERPARGASRRISARA